MNPRSIADDWRERCSRLRNELTALVEPKMLDALSSNIVKTPSVASKRVFFGHGRSEQWRILKDYVVEKLCCTYDEYNREATAGLSRKEVLSTKLKNADFAFLIMTGEDIHADGTVRARENVVHEIGLFQGKLGFEKAIVILEDGCNEFSNIAGLDQIRFTGNIMSIAHEVRETLVREGIIRA